MAVDLDSIGSRTTKRPRVCTKAIIDVSAADFENPPQTCDIVMKGGITSGIVYPAAILRIAQRFRFKNIGGTSAGAIAAAVAASAEFCRQSKASGAGFTTLKSSIMDWLAQGRNLQSLFVPVIAAVPIFYLFLFLLGFKSGLRRASIRGAFNIVVTIVIIAVVLLGYVEALFQFRVQFLNGVPQAVAMLLILLAIALIACVIYVLPRNNYGMCSGGTQDTIRGSSEPLTFWLSRQVDDIASTGTNRPLTFGDLWFGRIRNDDELDVVFHGEPVVNLAMVTTCLTMGRPFRLPFEQGLFYFRSEELRRFFPAYVVAWLEQHGRKPNALDETSVRRHAYLKDRGYLPLPSAANLPVIVAARMSLSFPLLLSAIRLYAVDYTLPHNKKNRTTPCIEPAWFSDGGLSSNFPISFFDSPIPRWPTLAITLESFPPGMDSGDPANGAYVPTDNDVEPGSIWTRFSEGRVPSNTPGFYGAVVNAMQNWQDTMQSEAPGFRDRIAHVRLGAQEGGLNLTMPPAVIKTLMQRGELAGTLLVEHFRVPIPQPPTEMTWDNHRWIRLRTALDGLQRYALDFGAAWNASAAPCRDYATLVLNGMVPPPHSYRFDYPEQSAAAMSIEKSLSLIARATASTESSLSGAGAPKPISDLHARPRF